MSAAADHHSLTQLAQTFGSDLGLLVRQELVLARTEMTAKVKAVAISASVLVMGVGLAIIAAVMLVVTIVLGLATFMPAWIAALVVFAILASGSAIAVVLGSRMLRSIEPLPTHTIASISHLVRGTARSGASHVE
jgi:hypothetical protein